MKTRTTLRRRAFTLLELLVVISILSLLMSLLLPALERARKASREAVCGSNLHQIGLALAQYSGDYFDMLPREGLPRMGRLDNHISWPLAIGPYLSADSKMDLTSAVLQDPEHPNPNHFSHYVMNGFSFKVGRRGGIREFSADRRGVWPARLVQRPSEIIYMTSFTDDPDNSIIKQVIRGSIANIAVYDAWTYRHLYGPNTGSNRDATNVRRVQWDRHGTHNNVLHFDLHVSKMVREQIMNMDNWYDGVPRRDFEENPGV